ncbi:MAG: D-glycero-beta-D-manno-heptose 1-phosphate adenylyltransferase [Chitinophagaceae bacterium]|jgi:rfaE bifunctional protein nucleotidyltransferase chain/domain
MKATKHISDKILSADEIARQAERWRLLSKRIVFTNGCFDILHAGHLDLLARAAAMGDVLVVGLNSDASVQRLKGPERPVNDQDFRSQLLSHLQMVDAVILFGEDTPLELIRLIRPDVLVKGGDYQAEDVVGFTDVTAGGGCVEIIPLVEGLSTSAIIDRIRTL